MAALLFAGRAGASITAEIGLMRAGEQLTALEMMAVDPKLRVLAPRFWGGIIALPYLNRRIQCRGYFGWVMPWVFCSLVLMPVRFGAKCKAALMCSKTLAMA